MSASSCGRKVSGRRKDKGGEDDIEQPDAEIAEPPPQGRKLPPPSRPAVVPQAPREAGCRSRRRELSAPPPRAFYFQIASSCRSAPTFRAQGTRYRPKEAAPRAASRHRSRSRNTPRQQAEGGRLVRWCCPEGRRTTRRGQNLAWAEAAGFPIDTLWRYRGAPQWGRVRWNTLPPAKCPTEAWSRDRLPPHRRRYKFRDYAVPVVPVNLE